MPKLNTASLLCIIKICLSLELILSWAAISPGGEEERTNIDVAYPVSVIYNSHRLPFKKNKSKSFHCP